MDFIRSNKNAQWLVPIAAGLFSCVCSCAAMFCLLMAMMPAGSSSAGMSPSEAFQHGMDLAQANPSLQIFSLAFYCVPPFLMLAVGVVVFFVVRSYQQRSVSPVSTLPPNPPVG